MKGLRGNYVKDSKTSGLGVQFPGESTLVIPI